MTNGISSTSYTDSSRQSDRGQCSESKSPQPTLSDLLAERLQSRIDLSGSMEYRLIWKRHVTPSGRAIYRLRASRHRTSDPGYGGVPNGRTAGWPSPRANKWGEPDSHGNAPLTGYPTPRVTDADKSVRTWEGSVNEMRRKEGPQELPCAAHLINLTDWPTASARDWKNGKASQQTLDRNARPLSEIVRLAGWGTPRKEGHSSGNPQRADDGMARLEDQVHGLAGWASPNAIPESRGGLQSNPEKALERRTNGHQLNLDDQVCLGTGMPTPSSPASTDTHAGSLQLNPEFTRWLLGYPDAW